MSKVRIITTGGTIASLPQQNGEVRAVLDGKELVDHLQVSVDVDVYSSVTLGSFALTLQHLRDIAVDVQRALLDDDVSGVVITHGTDTMEETTFYLSLVCPRSKPIVITGAQLNAGEPSSDGIRNLRDAVLVASTPAATEWGPVICFAGFIHTARDVRKVDTNALQAFDSPNWGPVGRVDQGRVIVNRRFNLLPIFPTLVPESVCLIRLTLGFHADDLRRMTKGYRGVVLQAFGRGNGPPSLPEEVQRLTEAGIPVAITSRCYAGDVAPIYGGGGGRDLDRAGGIFAGDLTGEKTRLLLGLLLANHSSEQDIRKYLSIFGAPTY